MRVLIALLTGLLVSLPAVAEERQGRKPTPHGHGHDRQVYEPWEPRQHPGAWRYDHAETTRGRHNRAADARMRHAWTEENRQHRRSHYSDHYSREYSRSYHRDPHDNHHDYGYRHRHGHAHRPAPYYRSSRVWYERRHRPRYQLRHGWCIGDRYPHYRHRSRYIDHHAYGLPAPRRGHRWYLHDGDALLVGVATGLIIGLAIDDDDYGHRHRRRGYHH